MEVNIKLSVKEALAAMAAGTLQAMLTGLAEPEMPAEVRKPYQTEPEAKPQGIDFEKAAREAQAKRDAEEAAKAEKAKKAAEKRAAAEAAARALAEAEAAEAEAEAELQETNGSTPWGAAGATEGTEYTLEEVRAKLATLTKTGKRADVQALISSFGGAKVLTEIDKAHYPVLMAKAAKL